MRSRKAVVASASLLRLVAVAFIFILGIPRWATGGDSLRKGRTIEDDKGNEMIDEKVKAVVDDVAAKVNKKMLLLKVPRVAVTAPLMVPRTVTLVTDAVHLDAVYIRGAAEPRQLSDEQVGVLMDRLDDDCDLDLSDAIATVIDDYIQEIANEEFGEAE